ncbi:MAG: hypothetical protein Q8P99_02040, partial [bacterium]|nr:hypothetical protein [bacterium]
VFPELDKEKRVKRIHVGNGFNKNHSIVLSSFEDVRTLSNRLGENIDAWVKQESKVQQMPGFKSTKSGRYPEEAQVEMKKGDKLGKEVRIDFKALYVFSKILLDKYVKFLYFINPVDGIRSGTIDAFLNSLENSVGNPESFYGGLSTDLEQTSGQILNKLTFYRSKKIEHEQLLNEDVWFMNDMRGGIAISHVDRDGDDSVVTIQPGELLDLLKDFLAITSSYFMRNRDRIT